MSKEAKGSSKDSWKTKLDHCLHDKNCRFATFLGALEDNTGIERTKIVIGFCSVIALYLMVGYGKDFLCNLIGFIYPAYASVKAIESPQKDDDTKWLTYWVVYSLFVVVESFTDILFSWIPLYFLIKCAFLVYCMLPMQWNGSLVIYKRFIRPCVLKHQSQVDAGIKYAVDTGRDVVSGVETAAEKLVRDAVIGNMMQQDREEDVHKED